MPRGASASVGGVGEVWRSTRTSVLGPAINGFPIVGMPLASTVMRTTMSEFWIAIHASLPSGLHAIATGFVRNSRGAGVVLRLTPWLRFKGAVRRTVGSDWGAVTSESVPVSNSETRPCAIWLNRSGPFGDAPVETTYAFVVVGRIATSANWLGNAPVGVVKACGFEDATAGTRRF